MSRPIACLWSDENGQDIAEYAVMLAVILVIVVGTIRLIGSNENDLGKDQGAMKQRAGDRYFGRGDRIRANRIREHRRCVLRVLGAAIDHRARL